MPKANIRMAMEMLDPEEWARVCELPNYMARESFRLEEERVDSFDQLRDICRRYFVHNYRRVIAEHYDPQDDFIRGMAWNLLEHHYKGGAEAAYKAASRGLNGGLPGVLDAIRDYFIRELEERYFDHTIMECVDVMDLEDVETLMQQYLQRYGRHMDGDNLPSARYLVPKFREILKAHSQVVRNMRMSFGR